MEGGLHIPRRSVQLGGNAVMAHLGKSLGVNIRQQASRFTAPDGIGFVHFKFSGIDFNSPFFRIHPAGDHGSRQRSQDGQISFHHHVIESTVVKAHIISDSNVDFRKHIKGRISGIAEKSKGNISHRIFRFQGTCNAGPCKTFDFPKGEIAVQRAFIIGGINGRRMDMEFPFIIANLHMVKGNIAVHREAAAAKGCTSFQMGFIAGKGQIHIHRRNGFIHSHQGQRPVLYIDAAQKKRIVIAAGHCQMTVDGTAGRSDRLEENSKHIHVRFIQIDIQVQRYRLVCGASGEYIARKGALHAGPVLTPGNEAILHRNHIVGRIGHERHAVKGDVAIPRVINAYGNISHRRFFIS